ncbi:MAG: NAD(P)/FAD-dependent oxidoreductase [Muribaculaceae bacterium]|nr:NAD(P)/FAD-dependent oxidoreductase [Muribaculaceae bacterium]
MADNKNTSIKKPRMVIIGGGFAGLNFVKRIDRTKWEVILIDKNNFHSFPPLFYQVATSGVDPSSISFPLRRELRSRAKGALFNMGTVKSIDTTKKQVTTNLEALDYDQLVIAAGTTNNFYGIPNLEKNVYTLKSTAEAIRCRNDILDRLERAAIIEDAETRRKLLTFTIIGGGPTGVEVAGALGEMKKYILKREYPRIEQDDVTVNIIEGSDRLLRTMSEKASQEALKYMAHLMVNVTLGKTMSTYEHNIIRFTDGEEIYSEMVIWTAGITGEPFTFVGKQPEMGPGNRFIVDEFNRVQGVDDIFAIGDICLHMDEKYPRGCPQLAQVAIQQAKNLAYNLNRQKFSHPFVYKDKGTMATVGRNRAVCDFNHFHMSGLPAWFTWMLVHLMSLLGMRNKIMVFITWIWSYFTYSSGARLLLHTNRYPLRKRWEEC